MNFGSKNTKVLCNRNEKSIRGYHNWRKAQKYKCDPNDPMTSMFWMSHLVYYDPAANAQDRVVRIEKMLGRSIVVTEELKRFLLEHN